MSWSKSITSCPVREVGTRLRATANIYGGTTPEIEEQAEAATVAAEALVKVVQPDPDGTMNVTVAGHANAGHQKDAHFANDAVSVSIYQT